MRSLTETFLLYIAHHNIDVDIPSIDRLEIYKNVGYDAYEDEIL